VKASVTPLIDPSYWTSCDRFARSLFESTADGAATLKSLPRTFEQNVKGAYIFVPNSHNPPYRILYPCAPKRDIAFSSLESADPDVSVSETCVRPKADDAVGSDFLPDGKRKRGRKKRALLSSTILTIRIPDRYFALHPQMRRPSVESPSLCGGGVSVPLIASPEKKLQVLQKDPLRPLLVRLGISPPKTS